MANIVIRADEQRWASITPVLAAFTAAVACATVLPSPLTSIASMRGGVAASGWRQLDELVLAAAGLVSWTVIGWFGLVAALTLVARATGPHGRVAVLMLRGLAPRALRTALATAVGLGSVAALTACSPGATAASTPRPMTTVAELLADPAGVLAVDWPSAASLHAAGDPSTTAAAIGGEAVALPTALTETVVPTTPTGGAEVDLDWPEAPSTVGAPDPPVASPATIATSPEPTAPATPSPPLSPPPSEPPPASQPIPTPPMPAPTSPAPAPPQEPAAPVTTTDGPAAADTASADEAPTRVVVVTVGDTLWAIAADHLPAAADDSEIAAAWPEWYAANRALIGDDPDLILPGWQLTTPTPDGDESP